MFEAVTVQRGRLVDSVEALSDDQWNTQSLCAGWRVRDVLGHLISILEIPIGKFLVNVLKARDFDRYVDRVAREIGNRDSKDLVAALRSNADKRLAPPFVGPIAPLTDVYIHTRDIERPLGLPSQLDAEGLRTILDYVCGGKAIGFVPGKRTKGLRFEATDLGWSIGTGPVLSGPGEAIMLAVTGRKAALADLTGDGGLTLAQRLG